MTLQTAASPPLPKLVASTETLREIGASVTADLSAQAVADAVAAGSIRLEGTVGVKVIASNATESYVENIGQVAHDMPVLKRLAGFGFRNYVVTRVQRVEKAQIVIVSQRSGNAGLRAQLSTIAAAKTSGSAAGHDVLVMKGVSGPLMFDVTRVLIIGATAYSLGTSQFTAIVGEELQGAQEPLGETDDD